MFSINVQINILLSKAIVIEGVREGVLARICLSDIHAKWCHFRVYLFMHQREDRIAYSFLSSNIPSSPAYGVFISQLIRHARAFSSYECFILRVRRLSSKLLKQGYLVERLKLSFRKFYGRYGDLVEQYGVTLSRMLNDILTLDQQ